MTAERLAGEPVAAVGVDGCGAPVFALTLTGLARAFAPVRAGRAGHAAGGGGWPTRCGPTRSGWAAPGATSPR